MGDSTSPIPPDAGHSTGHSTSSIPADAGHSTSPICPDAGDSTSPMPPGARHVARPGKAASLLGISALVIADALSKIMAVLLLPAGAPVRLEAALQLVLSLNDLGIGRWART